MNRHPRLRQILITLTTTLTIVGLTGCFLFEDPLIIYGVQLWLYDPHLKLEPFCYGVDLTATFGDNTLLDIQVDQSDPDAPASAQEVSRVPQQRYYAGMPLVVHVVCRNLSGGEIGRSLYEGRLTSPREPAFFVLFNYSDPEIDFSTCIPPTTATGVQMCATGYGFEFQ